MKITRKGDDLIAKAKTFAVAAHGAIGQIRKYTGEPYVNHCESVANLVRECETASAEMISAAWLHDTVEDTDITPQLIAQEFGKEVANLVFWMTDISTLNDGNREQRKRIDRERWHGAPPSAQTVKLADLIDNTHSIVARDPEFAKIYVPEKRLLLKFLKQGDQHLYTKAMSLVENLADIIKITHDKV